MAWRAWSPPIRSCGAMPPTHPEPSALPTSCPIFLTPMWCWWARRWLWREMSFRPKPFASASRATGPSSTRRSTSTGTALAQVRQPCHSSGCRSSTSERMGASGMTTIPSGWAVPAIRVCPTWSIPATRNGPRASLRFRPTGSRAFARSGALRFQRQRARSWRSRRASIGAISPSHQPISGSTSFEATSGSCSKAFIATGPACRRACRACALLHAGRPPAAHASRAHVPWRWSRIAWPSIPTCFRRASCGEVDSPSPTPPSIPFESTSASALMEDRFVGRRPSSAKPPPSKRRLLWQPRRLHVRSTRKAKRGRSRSMPPLRGRCSTSSPTLPRGRCPSNPTLLRGRSPSSPTTQ